MPGTLSRILTIQMIMDYSKNNPAGEIKSDDDKTRHPCRNSRPGRVWACALGLAFAGLTTALAYAQSQPAGEAIKQAVESPSASDDRSVGKDDGASYKNKLNVLLKRADRFRGEGKYQAALQIYQQMLTLLGERDYTRGQAVTLRRIGTTYKNLHQPSKALASYKQSLALFSDLGEPGREARVLIDMGNIYRSQGNYPAALEAYNGALTLRRPLKDSRGIAGALINIGVVHFEQSRYARASTYYEEAIAILEALDNRDPIVYAKALSNQALNFTELGQYSRALELYRQALPIIEQTKDLVTTGAVLHNTGFAYSKAGIPSEALQYYERALRARSRVADEKGMASTMNNMGFVLSKQGQDAGALQLFDQALALSRKINATDIEGRTLDSQGDTYARMGKFDRAQAVYHEALAIRKQLGDRRGARVTLANIGRVFQEQGSDELAIVFYKQAVNVSEAIRGELGGLAPDIRSSYTKKVSRVYRRLADLLLKHDRVGEAQQVLDLLKLQELEEYSIEVRGSPETRRGIDRFSEEQQIVRQHDEIFNRFVETLKVLSDLERRKESLTDAEREQLKKLTGARKQFSKRFMDFVKSPEVRNWKKSINESSLNINQLVKLQDTLGKLKNTVLFYPLVLEDRLELVLVTAFAPPVHSAVPIKRQALEDIISRFRSELTNPGSDPAPSAQLLYDLLIRPLQPAFDAAGAQTIIYAPDRALRYIPLSALHDGQQWLVERYKSHRITASSLSDLNTRPSGELRIFAGAFSSGDLEFKAGEQNFRFSGLPFARLEVEGLAKMIPNTKTIFDRDFTPDVIEQEAGFHTVVHLATHAAFLTGHPDESFILFGNGERLTLLDVESEWPGVLRSVELVVLSACETGIGGKLENGDEILGFGALMEAAGADASIATLWPIADGGTQVLMDAFYRGLHQKRVTKTEAMQNGQVMLIHNSSQLESIKRGVIAADGGKNFKGPLSHPYYWSPFILIGNGR